MHGLLADLIALLDLEELEVNIFRGHGSHGWQRIFGGQVLGQALVAAGRTVESGIAHSLHGYFLRPGDRKAPILYQVDRTRDGRSFTTRRVVAIQHGQVIFQLEASFQISEPGPEHQDEMPDVPEPESLPTWRACLKPLLDGAPVEHREWMEADLPIDIRQVSRLDSATPDEIPARFQVWLRADGQLPDDTLIHQSVVAYASDMTLLDAATLPHGISWRDPKTLIASLDHAMWFHREFRADEWLLYDQRSPAAAGARGFATGRLFTRNGRLVVSVVQEGLMRRMTRGTS